jgi:hypothetical protein
VPAPGYESLPALALRGADTQPRDTKPYRKLSDGRRFARAEARSRGSGDELDYPFMPLTLRYELE